MTDFIVGVAVENTGYSFDKIFDYGADASFADSLCVGKRVLVPFGNGNRKRQGMIMYLRREQSDKLKSVISVLDEFPVMTGEMVALAVFMRNHYFCTYYDAVKAMLPAGINYSITTLYTAVKGVDCDGLSDSEAQVYNYVLSHKKSV